MVKLGKEAPVSQTRERTHFSGDEKLHQAHLLGACSKASHEEGQVSSAPDVEQGLNEIAARGESASQAISPPRHHAASPLLRRGGHVRNREGYSVDILSSMSGVWGEY